MRSHSTGLDECWRTVPYLPDPFPVVRITAPVILKNPVFSHCTVRSHLTGLGECCPMVPRYPGLLRCNLSFNPAPSPRYPENSEFYWFCGALLLSVSKTENRTELWFKFYVKIWAKIAKFQAQNGPGLTKVKQEINDHIAIEDDSESVVILTEVSFRLTFLNDFPQEGLNLLHTFPTLWF